MISSHTLDDNQHSYLLQSPDLQYNIAYLGEDLKLTDYKFYRFYVEMECQDILDNKKICNLNKWEVLKMTTEEKTKSDEVKVENEFEKTIRENKEKKKKQELERLEKNKKVLREYQIK